MTSIMATTVVVVCLFLSCVCCQINVWPLPQTYSHGTTPVSVSPSFQFTSKTNSHTMREAFKRYTALTFTRTDVSNTKQYDEAVLSTLDVIITDPSEDLQLDTREDYTLVVTSTSATINASTVYAAMRGLETFSQLVQYNISANVYTIQQAPWSISDHPRFPHRGLLMDTSRHFFSVHYLHKLLDSMSYAKMNVLHWHIVDAQSFPMQSAAYPLLWKGAWSPSERYTTQDVKDVVEYARLRGIRVVPEFDGPGHAYAWGVGYPSLLPQGYNISSKCDDTCPVNPCNVPLDPSNEFTYQVLEGLFTELTAGKQGAGIFTDNMFHTGGDEIEPGCWSGSPQIAQFMKQHSFTSYDELYMYFVNRVAGMVKGMGRQVVNWESTYTTAGNTLDKGTIVNIYLSMDVMEKAVGSGYQCIVSFANAWYLDNVGNNWTVFYNFNPVANLTDPSLVKLVLGGEASNWGETMDPTNLFARVWPRAAAVAERLWSAASVTSLTDALPRLHAFRCMLIDRDIPSAPLDNLAGPLAPGSCLWQ
eukprot:TRINITY_DN1724_c0_g1_i3.p1 TRINITY_DN1724_c0_g1~~TRINITY_DN1724_c0_g1_i3.p1  ORF type:complete len:531 (+),score=117.02 TRINITY_DN1724_c0_g1_i3:2207-3799(+)